MISLLRKKPISIEVEACPLIAPYCGFSDDFLENAYSELKNRWRTCFGRKLNYEEIILIQAILLKQYNRIVTPNYKIDVWRNKKLKTFSALLDNGHHKTIYWPDLFLFRKSSKKSKDNIKYRTIIFAAGNPSKAESYYFWFL